MMESIYHSAQEYNCKLLKIAFSAPTFFQSHSK